MNPADSTGTDWFSAVAVLAVGLSAGAVLVWRAIASSRRAAQARTVIPVEVRDLSAKQDALLLQLRELEDSAGKRTPEQLARERYQLELDAAQVLLALEGRQTPAPPAGQRKRSAAPAGLAAPPEPPRKAGLRGFFWGTGSATTLLLLGFFVYQSAKPREAGGSVTGELPARGGPMSAGTAAGDRDEAAIKAALGRDPNDVEARLALAQLLLQRHDLMGVWNESARVLQQDPRQPRALANTAIVRLAMGQPAVAVDLLTKALSSDPNLADAYVYLAICYQRMGRPDDARMAIAAVSKRFPERAAEFQRALAEQQQQQAPGAGARSEPDPHAAVATPGSGKDPAAARASSGPRVAGIVDLDPALRKSIPPAAVLFVFVRAAGVSTGPPVAAKRLPPTFPAAFELSESDSMMGVPFPDPLLIEARLDEDGDPTTRAPTDPRARLDNVKAGRTDLRLVLKRP